MFDFSVIDDDSAVEKQFQVFYRVGLAKLPRIFGMTASPKLGKGKSYDVCVQKEATLSKP